jgi:hypothetical protein
LCQCSSIHVNQCGTLLPKFYHISMHQHCAFVVLCQFLRCCGSCVW